MTCVARFGSHISHRTEIALATHTIFCHTSEFIAITAKGISLKQPDYSMKTIFHE